MLKLELIWFVIGMFSMSLKTRQDILFSTWFSDAVCPTANTSEALDHLWIRCYCHASSHCIRPICIPITKLRMHSPWEQSKILLSFDHKKPWMCGWNTIFLKEGNRDLTVFLSLHLIPSLSWVLLKQEQSFEWALRLPIESEAHVMHIMFFVTFLHTPM